MFGELLRIACTRTKPDKYGIFSAIFLAIVTIPCVFLALKGISVLRNAYHLE